MVEYFEFDTNRQISSKTVRALRSNMPCGKRSYPIHIPQCQKKWLIEETKKPENERRRLPQPPYDEEPIIAGRPPQEDDFGGE